MRAALAALEIIRNEPHRRKELLQAPPTSARGLARKAGVSLPLPPGEGRGEGLSSQIIPLIVGDPNRTMEMSEKLREAGFFIPGIRPPSVPDGESLLRLSLCYHHTPEMMDNLVVQLAGLRPAD